jgi:hypothetical protein
MERAEVDLGLECPLRSARPSVADRSFRLRAAYLLGDRPPPALQRLPVVVLGHESQREQALVHHVGLRQPGQGTPLRGSPAIGGSLRSRPKWARGDLNPHTLSRTGT